LSELICSTSTRLWLQASRLPAFALFDLLLDDPAWLAMAFC